MLERPGARWQCIFSVVSPIVGRPGPGAAAWRRSWPTAGRNRGRRRRGRRHRRGRLRAGASVAAISAARACIEPLARGALEDQQPVAARHLADQAVSMVPRRRGPIPGVAAPGFGARLHGLSDAHGSGRLARNARRRCGRPVGAGPAGSSGRHGQSGAVIASSSTGTGARATGSAPQAPGARRRARGRSSAASRRGAGCRRSLPAPRAGSRPAALPRVAAGQLGEHQHLLEAGLVQAHLLGARKRGTRRSRSVWSVPAAGRSRPASRISRRLAD